jgi:flagellar hook-length control protein FliK
MNEQITSSNILGVAGGATIASQNSQKSVGNSSPLGEKFQFSEVLGATIDSPEKTYSDAQKPKDPADNIQTTKTSPTDQDDFSTKYNDEVAPTENRDDDFGSSPKDKDDGDKVEKNPNTKEQSAHYDDGDRSASSDNQKQVGNNTDQKPDEVFGKTLQEDTADPTEVATKAAAPVAAVKAQENTPAQTKVPREVAADKASENVAKTIVKAAENNGQVTSKSAGEVVSSALRDNKISKVGEDLHKAVFKNTKEVVIEQKAPSIGNALANKQEQDLSKRLKNSAFSPVKVTVENNANKMNAMPSHTKAPIAQLAELSLEEGQSTTSTAAAAKLATAGEAKAANSHSINSDAKIAAQNQQENSLNVNQMLRQQAATMGAQQAAASQSAMGQKAPITADIPNINAVAGPAGPNQPQQVTKVAPPPPPPPPKPPAPIEQVAVQIKKAIGAGVDKINIRLNPAHLGQVEVKMEIARDGQLTATVIAEKPETLDLLQRDVRGLERALQDGGLKTNMQSFQFSLKEQAQQQAATGRDQNNGQQGKSDQNNGSNAEDAHSIASQAAVYGQNVATNGGVDIRI